MENADHELKVNFTAGFKVLTKFQNQWEHIHSKSERNVNKAQTASSILAKLEQSSNQQLNALDSFISSYKSITRLGNQIKDIEIDLRLLESSFAQIEDHLTILRNHKENVETDEYVVNLKTHFKQQAKEARLNLELRKEKLKQEHLERVEEIERKQLAELDLKRHLYEKAFEEEKNQFLERKGNKHT